VKAYGGLGKIEEGLTLVVETLKKEVDAGAYVSEAELYRLKGELLRMQEGSRLQALGHREKTEEAEACLLKAIEIARQQQAKSWELRATISLARLWQSQGKTEEAQKMLAEIYGWFTEGFDTKDLQEAKTLLETLQDREVEGQGEKNGPRRGEPVKRAKKGPKQQRSAAACPEIKALNASSRQVPVLPLPDKPSLAVLPFVNLSEDPGQDYFSDGFTEVLTSDLSRIPGLFVISRHSAFTFKGKAVTMQEVSQELGVQYVVEGSVQKARERVRISVQFIDALRDYHVWSERYDRSLPDIFAVQDDVVQRIVTTLKLQLTLHR
jgi:TolB-like protein